MARKRPNEKESPFTPAGDLEDESNLDEVLMEESDDAEPEIVDAHLADESELPVVEEEFTELLDDDSAADEEEYN